MQNDFYVLQCDFYDLQNDSYVLGNDFYGLRSDSYTLQSDSYGLRNDFYEMRNDFYALQNDSYELRNDFYEMQNGSVQNYSYGSVRLFVYPSEAASSSRDDGSRKGAKMRDATVGTRGPRVRIFVH